MKQKLLALTGLMLSAKTTFAQGIHIVTAEVHSGNASLNSVGGLVSNWTSMLLSVAGSIAVLMIMYGGFWYMIGGTTNDKEKGKMIVMYAVGGLFVAFFAWWIVKVIAEWMTT